jgi:zinc transport system ATP-binding protein
MLLEVKNLNVFYSKNHILEDVSFSIDEGKIIAIIGPNGGGKTTLFRAILGAVPYSGKIIWHKAAKIGYVPQRFDFDPTFPLNVFELFLLRTSNKDFWFTGPNVIGEIRNTLAHAGAGHLIYRKVSELSSGELQRVLIAYAIFGHPNILLFDEPTSGIDIEGEITAYNLIQHLAKELNLTVLLISHDLNVVFEYVDEAICLNKRLLCAGAPKKILTPAQLQELYGVKPSFYHHAH